MIKPSVWYLFPNMNIGGAEKHVIRLASGLKRQGFDVGIATVFEPGDLEPVIREAGISFACLGARQGWHPGTFFRIRDWVRSQRMDILHTYLFGFHFFAGLPARNLKVPVIISSRRELAHWQKKRHRLLENLGNLVVDQVVCCSQAAELWTLENERIEPKKLKTIYNGIAPDYFETQGEGVRVREELGIPKDALVMGTVANFSEVKGYPYLLQSIEQVYRQNPAAWFLLVGSGPLMQKMQEEAKRNAAYDQIVFAGKREDVRDCLAAMDVFVLASLSEGFPNVLLEAMAASKPVVATSVGGIPELIVSGENGVLVPAKDPDAIAQEVAVLFAANSQAERMAQKALQTVQEKFTEDQMIQTYAALYQDLLTQNKEVH